MAGIDIVPLPVEKNPYEDYLLFYSSELFFNCLQTNPFGSSFHNLKDFTFHSTPPGII